MVKLAATAVIASVALALPAVAGAQLSVRVEGLQGGKRPALERTTAVGTLSPFAPGDLVRVQFVRGRKVVSGQRVAVSAEDGTFRLRSPRLAEPGRYRVRVRTAAGAEMATERFRLRFPSLGRGDRGFAVWVLHRRPRRQG
jgi:hypothetical protein